MYVCRLGTLWFCYITQKLFSPNPETCRIDPKIVLPVLGPFPTKEYFCGNGVAINMLSEKINSGRYIGYTQYESIRKFQTAHVNIYGASV